MATREELYTALRNADAAGDNAGAAKLAAYIQGLPAEAPPEAPPDALKTPPQALWGNVVGSAPYKALGGVADTLLNAPYNAINLGKMAYGAGTAALGRPDLSPEITPPPNFATNALIKGGMITPTNNMSPAQRVMDIGLQTATGAALNPAQSGQALARNMLLGGTAGAAGQATTEVTGSPLAGLAVTLAVPAVIETAAQAMQAAAKIQKARNATRDATYTAGQELGLQAPPGNVNPSLKNVMLETTGGKISLAQNMAEHNQGIIDNVARKAVGLAPDTPLTPETMQAVRAEEYTKGYAPVAAVGVVPTDANFKQALQDIRDKFTGAGKSFPGATPDIVKKLTKTYDVASFEAADALPAIQILRDAAKASFLDKQYALGKAQIATSKALEDQIERQLITANNPQAAAMLDQFRASRVRMAVSHALEDAIQVGTGSVNGKQLASDIQQGKFLTDELADVAKFANTFKTAVKVPGQYGTPGAGTGLIHRAMSGGAGAVLGGMTGIPGGAAGGAVLGSIASEAIAGGAQKLLRSDYMQRNALPSYAGGNFMGQETLNPALRNALLTIPQNQNALNTVP